MALLLLAFTAGLLIGGGFVLVIYRRRKTLYAGRRQGAEVAGPFIPTDMTLDGLEHYFQRRVTPALLGRRLAGIYAILFAPPLVLSHLDEPWLAQQVEQKHLANNTALFLGLAALERAREGRTFGDNPANTMAVYLRRQFKQRGWHWPTHPLAWKEYFLNTLSP